MKLVKRVKIMNRENEKAMFAGKNKSVLTKEQLGFGKMNFGLGIEKDMNKTWNHYSSEGVKSKTTFRTLNDARFAHGVVFKFDGINWTDSKGNYLIKE